MNARFPAFPVLGAWLLAGAVCVLPALVRAQELDADSDGDVLGAEQTAPTESPSDDGDLDEPVWGGPHVELGYSHFVLPDGYGAGSYNGGFFGGYLPLDMWLRVGLAAEAGVRSYELGPDDLLIRGTLTAGYQHLGLGRFMPYAVGVATVGPLVGKRFHTSFVDVLAGGGVEIGCDVNLALNLFAGIGISYVRAAVGSLAYDLFIFRFSIGL
jgi:hypothetical protein